MLQKFFSYIPRSGSRVITSKHNKYVAISRIQAGTVVAGNLAVLQFYTAAPGENYCRYEAHRLCKEIVDLVGGFAEDDRGNITLAVPAHKGWDAYNVISGLLPLTPCERLSMRRQLWWQGLVKLSSVEDYQPVEVQPEPIRVLPAWHYSRKLQKDIPGVCIVLEKDYEKHVRLELDCVPYTIFITDRGWSLSAVYGDDIVVNSPYYKEHFLDITEPEAIKLALSIIKDDRFPASPCDLEEDLCVEWAGISLIKVDDTVSLQVFRGGVDDSVFDQLIPLAASVNCHADLPSWAGWEHRQYIC